MGSRSFALCNPLSTAGLFARVCVTVMLKSVCLAFACLAEMGACCEAIYIIVAFLCIFLIGSV